MRGRSIGDDAALAALFAAAIWLAGTAGCATGSPRYVEAVESSEETVKFVYREETAGGEWRRGIIECDLEDESFRECRHLDVEYDR